MILFGLLITGPFTWNEYSRRKKIVRRHDYGRVVTGINSKRFFFFFVDYEKNKGREKLRALEHGAWKREQNKESRNPKRYY